MSWSINWILEVQVACLPFVNHHPPPTNYWLILQWYCHGWFLQHKSQWIEAAYYSKTIYNDSPLTWDKVAYYCKAKSPDLTNQGLFRGWCDFNVLYSSVLESTALYNRIGYWENHLWCLPLTICYEKVVISIKGSWSIGIVLARHIKTKRS